MNGAIFDKGLARITFLPFFAYRFGGYLLDGLLGKQRACHTRGKGIRAETIARYARFWQRGGRFFESLLRDASRIT